MGLDVVEFLLVIEQEFDLKLPDSEVSLISTVGELVDLVHQKLMIRHDLKHCPSNKAVFEKIKILLVNEYQIPEINITHQARFVQDLHMD